MQLLAAPAFAQTTNADLEPKRESDCHKIDEAFSEASDAEVALLFAHPNRGVRMRAFWERERRRPTTGAGRMERLIGNYEACLGMEPPKWWAQGLLHGEFEKPTCYEFSEQGLKTLRLRSVQLEDNFKPEVLGDIEVKLQGERILVSLGKQNVTLKKNDVVKRDREHGLTTMAVATSPNGNYLVQVDPFGTKFVVSRIADDGSARWFTEGWATGDYPGSGNGFCTCHVSIETRPESVFVFGYCGGSHFVEEFESKNGRPRMRFCSTYTRSKSK